MKPIGLELMPFKMPNWLPCGSVTEQDRAVGATLDFGIRLAVYRRRSPRVTGEPGRNDGKTKGRAP